MKRWISRLFAISSMAAVFAVSYVSLITSNVLFSDPAASPTFTSSSTSSNIPLTTKQELQTVLAPLGVTIALEQPLLFKNHRSAAAAPDAVSTQQALTLFKEEWLKYTPEFIKSTGLKKIYFVQQLTVEGQARAGMPEPIFEDALYFDVSESYVQSEGGYYMRRTYHHEFKHLIDYNFYGGYAAGAGEWLTCNLNNVRYGSGGAAMYADADYAHAEHPEEGFVNGYATSAIEEDRAEVYALFMTNPEKLQQLAANDQALLCKIAATKKLISSL